tara:strand:- start:63 stop:254 length:192 start_codon:yes stop_codon:yes gene_type:complete
VKNIAIIGAGMTGLSLAFNLQDQNITIFDKSWRPGGRVSTRNHENFFLIMVLIIFLLTIKLNN